MKKSIVFVAAVLSLMTMAGCRSENDASGSQTNGQQEEQPVREVTVPEIQIYTLGKVSESLCRELVDSLQRHYPKCRFMKNVPLPENAKTTKRHDHLRYRADLLNQYLLQFKTDSNVVVGFTSEDIGIDNFRNSAHYGIRGLALGIGKKVVVFSDYRGKRNELSRLVQHELAHAFGLRHCPHEGCVMQDQQGGNKLKNSPDFCADCKSFLLRHHWHF